MILRKCSGCGKYLPLDMFTGKQGYCKTCRRDYDWQYKYGISPEQYNKLSQEQNGRCKICGKEVSVLHVDHNKDTGEIRGLLCGDCNRALGLFHEDIHAMSRAIDYLIENEVKKYEG